MRRYTTRTSVGDQNARIAEIGSALAFAIAGLAVLFGRRATHHPGYP